MIQISDLNYRVGEAPLLTEYSTRIAQGEKRLILGRSGLGKTSLFKLILGFRQPQSGTIRINGLELGQDAIQEIRSQIFYLSQDIDLMDGKVEEVLDLIFQAQPQLEITPHDLEAGLEMLALSPATRDKEVGALSGGERQRVGLLIGFLLNRPIWLLDEPTAALDSTLKEAVAQRILDSRYTVIVISHDPVWQNHERIQLERWS